MSERIKQAAIDVAWGLVWAAMIIATVLFASGASEFIYVDF